MSDKKPGLDIADPFDPPATTPGLDIADPFAGASTPAAATAASPTPTPARPMSRTEAALNLASPLGMVGMLGGPRQASGRTSGEHAQDIGASFATGAASLLSGLGTLAGKAPNPVAALLPDTVTTAWGDQVAVPRNVNEAVALAQDQVRSVVAGKSVQEIAAPTAGPGIAGVYQDLQQGEIDPLKSDELRGKQDALGEVEGFLPAAKAVLTDPMLLEGFAAEQIPNLLLAGGGSIATARQATTAALGRGVAADAAKAIGTKEAAKQIAISEGVQEAGPAAQGAELDVLNRSTEELMAVPAFAELVQAGVDPLRARQQLADNAALWAAPVGYVAGLLGGKITGPLEADIFTRNLDVQGLSGLVSGKGAAKVATGVAKEAAEEVVQEGGSQLGQNLGVQQTVDPARALMEGVPEAAGIGAAVGGGIGGGLTAGGILASKPKGPLERVADAATGNAQRYSAAQQAAHDQAAAAAAFPNDNPAVLLESLRRQVDDPNATPAERAQALTELQALMEVEGRMLPGPDGFTVGPDGQAVAGAPSARPTIAPDARAPGDFGPGMTEQALRRGTVPAATGPGTAGDLFLPSAAVDLTPAAKTPEARGALERAIQQFPEMDWLRAVANPGGPDPAVKPAELSHLLARFPELEWMREVARPGSTPPAATPATAATSPAEAPASNPSAPAAASAGATATAPDTASARPEAAAPAASAPAQPNQSPATPAPATAPESSAAADAAPGSPAAASAAPESAPTDAATAAPGTAARAEPGPAAEASAAPAPSPASTPAADQSAGTDPASPTAASPALPPSDDARPGVAAPAPAAPPATPSALPASPDPAAATTGDAAGQASPQSGPASVTAPSEGSGDATPAAAAIQAAADSAASSPSNDLTPPTQAQKDAGNYKKGHVRVAGHDISIETPAGVARRPEWGPLTDHYGYIKGTVGKDKDHLDVFLTPDAHDESRPVFVVDQRTAKGAFDEHKVILGAATLEDAKAAYKRNYTPGWRGMGAVTQMTQAQFKAWSQDKAATQQPAKDAQLAADAAAVPAAPAAPAKPERTGPAIGASPEQVAARASIAKDPGFKAAWTAATAQDDATAKTLGAPSFQQGYLDAQAGKAMNAAAIAEDTGTRTEGFYQRGYTAARHAGIASDFAANRQAVKDRGLKKGVLVHWTENGKIRSGTIKTIDKDQGTATVLVPGRGGGTGTSVVGARHLTKGPAPAAEAATPAAEAAPAAASAAPKTRAATRKEQQLVRKHGEPVQSGLDAQRRLDNGDRIFVGHELDEGGDLIEVLHYSVLDAYTADQMLALRRSITEPAAAAPKLSAKEQRRITVESERAAFTAIAGDASFIGKSVQDLVAALRARLTEALTPPATVLKMATTLHKQLAKNAAELAKAQHRDPGVYAAAVREAAGPELTGDALAQFQTGFQHAMQGRTKSSLVGDRLPEMLKGYEAAIKWRKTEEGRAWYEGRPVAKLENTGADLKRHMDALRAEAAKAQTDASKAWAALDKATNRARLFAPLLPDDVPPGVKVYVTALRDNVRPFKEWLEKRFSWNGHYHYRSKYSSNSKSNVEYMVAGQRYPSAYQSRKGAEVDIDEQRFQTDEAYRIAWLQERADEYLEQVQPLLAALQGARDVTTLATQLEAAMFKPGMAAETVRQKGRGYQQVQADKANGISTLTETDSHTATGLALLQGTRGRVWIGDKELWHFTPHSIYTQTLIEKEATIALPTKATPLTAPKLDHVTRAGLTDQRKGRDVTPAEVKETFGFADVGFGTWVGAKQDQDHLNYAFDAFMDLANHFGLPPKAIGLGGRLHFTIGALGHGKAAAHFQRAHPHPDGGTVPVINLTNTKGDGTVYHEWLHAFDLAGATGDWARVRKFMQGVFTHGVLTVEEVHAYADRFLFGGTYWKGDKNGDKVVAATKGMSWLPSHRGASTYKRNADALGADYWGNPEELLARAGEAWAADTLGGTNTYLVNPGWVGENEVTQAKNYRGTPYPTGIERTFFKEMFTALTKATTLTEHGLHVSWEKFEDALPATFVAGDKRRKELQLVGNMQQYQRDRAFERDQEQAARVEQAKAKTAAERAEADRLAAAALAELEASAPTQDTPPPSVTAGELSRADFEAIFDEAAAQLREETQEIPDAAPPGVTETPDLRNSSNRTPAATTAPAQPAQGEAAATTGTGYTAGSAAAAQPKGAAELLGEAARLGVKGADEALLGLSKLFGGMNKLNSFPAGFDEETYKAAKPHLQAALTHFQAAGRTLLDLYKALIKTYGDGIKEYLIRFSEESKLTATLGTAAAPSQVIADEVAARLGRGEAFDWRVLFEVADRAFGGTQAAGTYTPKDAYDALEAGINRYLIAQGNAFSPDTDRAGALLVADKLGKLLELVPTQTKRTAEQDEFQQFSTVPPFAFLANWVAGVGPDDVLLEPSAGIGGLAVFGRIAGAKLVLNELSSRRAAVLQGVFPGAKVYQENAEQIDNILPADVVPSVVVMNPPFSATAGRLQGERSTQVGAKHVRQALDRLAPGGRLVAIVGDGMRLDAPKFRAWWAEVQAEHTVRAVIPVDGSGYAKYGTTFDNVLLVIDKVAPKDRVAPITTPAKAYSDLVGLLAEIRDDRPSANLPANLRDGAQRDAAESARQEPVPAGERDPGTGPAAGQPGAVAGEQQRQPGPAAVGDGGRAGGRPGGSQRPGGGVRRTGNGNAAASGNAGGGRDGAGGAAGGPDPGGHATGVSIGEVAAAPHAELTDSTFEHYTPQRLAVPGAQPHPGPLVQSAAMASVLPPAPTYTPNLPPDVVSKGLLSIAQIEAVVYAGQAHAEQLPDGTRRAFFIGDGTGVGKGREIAGILLDNLRQGRKKAVWVSEKQDLFADAKRDFKAVSGDPDLIISQGKAPAAGALKAADGVMFTTYDTLKSGANLDPGKAKKAAAGKLATFQEGAKVVLTNGEEFPLKHIDVRNSRVVVRGDYGYSRTHAFSNVASIDGDASWNQVEKKASNSRLQQLVDWLGPDFDGALVFDEAHNAGNAVAMKAEGGRGTTKPSEKALAVVELQKLLPNARIVYVSATGATTVTNLAYASRLGLWGKGTPFASVMEFVAEMTAGGLATMELIARDMKQMGAYIARSLSFDGVEYDRVDHQLDPLQREIYDRLAEAWQVVLNNMNEALKVCGAVDENGTVRNSKAVAAAKSAFWGTQQRFFNQIITAMQMPSVVAAVEQDLAAGHAVVMQLVNTNEAQQDRALAKKKEEGESVELEDLDLTPRDALLSMVEKAFPVIEMETTRDESGKKVATPVLDSNGQPVENKKAVAMREKLLEDLRLIRVPDGPLEILLNHFGPELVAEVTGRSQRVVRRDAGDGEGVKATLEKRGAGSNKADADAFLADKKKILIFSDAGGTGFSFHADRTKANQRRRMHYLVQPGWRADKAVQGLGRSHRTNQASAPRFRLVSTDIPAHKRFLSAIARRLDMLGAMTKGQRDTANQGLFSEKDNLESKYATQAVRQLLEDAKRGQVPGLEFMPLLTQLGLEGLIDPNTGAIPEDKYPPTRQFLNRMLSLTLAMQETVFEAFIERMGEKIEVAAQRGELDAGMQTVRALSTRIVQDDTVYTDPRTGAETRFVELELTQPNRFHDFPESTERRPVEYLVNVASDRVWGRVKSGTETLKNGAVVDKFRMLGTGGLTVKNADEFGRGAYKEISAEEARTRWEKESSERPATVTKTAHMIVGALLPIWDRLKTEGTLQVMRTQTADGQRLLGRVVLAKDVAEIRKRLDVSSPAAKMSPSEIMARVLKGATAQLANGWTLVRAKVSDELRIELKAGNYLHGPALAELTSLGVITERIDWQSRFFVPIGQAGVPVLTELFTSKPVVDLHDPHAATDTTPVFRAVRDAGGRFAGKALTPEAAQAVVDRLGAQIEGVTAGGFRLAVVPSFADLPEALQAAGREQGVKPHEARGALHKGVLYLVAGNARSAADIEETVFHEAYGHAGVRLVLGNDTFPVLSGLARAMGGVAGIQRYAAANGVALGDYVPGILGLKELTAEQKLALLVDEVIAHIAQRGEPGLKRRALELLGRLATWLAEHGFTALAKLPALQLADLMRRARRAAQGAPSTGVRGLAPKVYGGAQFHLDFDEDDLTVAFDDDADPFVNNASGESSASIEAQNRLRDEQLMGRVRLLVEPNGTVRPLIGVDAVDTFARPGQIIVQRHIGREEWTVISQDTALSPELVRGRLNAARERLTEAAEEWAAPAVFHTAPTDRSGPALDALGRAMQPDPDWKAKFSSKVEDWRPAWLGALTLRHLAELGAKVLPQIGTYNDLVDAMSTDRNRQMERTAKTADKWAELQAKDPVTGALMAQLMHDSTIAGADPSMDFRAGTFEANDLGGEALITPGEVNRRIQILIGRKERSEDLAYQHAQDMRIERLREQLATEANRRRSYPDLVARYTALPQAAKDLFVEVRKTYEDASAATLEALAGRIMRLEIGEEQKTALVDRLRLQFEEARVQGPYFPLARFGDFWHAAVDADGEKAFFMYESHREWKAAKAQLAAKGYAVQRSGRKISKSRLTDGASGAFVTEVESILEAAGVDTDTRDEVYQLYLRTLPDLSQRKHFIHRKKVEGYSDDALRAFGANMFHGAHQLARLKHTDELAKQMREMQAQANRLADTDPEDAQRAAALYNEMLKRNEWVLNPRDSGLVSKISALGFVYYLGLTPASAFVNLTQTFVTALPVLGSRYGFGAANKALLAAGKLAGQHIVKGDLMDALQGDEREAYRTWLDRGVIDVTQAHNLAALAETDTTQFNRGAHKAMEVTSYLFHRTEVLNRQTTALAAYRLARKAGKSHEAATDYAAKATWESHFDYSNANRARFMQSGAAKILLMFRQYSLNMTWYLARNAQQAFTALDPEAKAEAQKKLMGTLGMTGLFAGALGLPMMWAVFGVMNAVHALFDDDDEPWDAETAFQNWMAETFGKDVAEILTRGVGNGVFGVDLASRTSLNNLWLREADRELEGRDAYHYWLEQAAGPVGGMFANVLRAKELIHDGQLYRGIETAVPKAVKDALKALRYATQGVNTLRGDPLVEDVSLRQVIAQASGFTPAEVSQRYDANRAIKNFEQQLLNRRSALLDGFALAFRLEDSEAMAQAQDRIIRWNEKHPELGIDGKTLERSIRARQRYSLQSEDGVNVNPRLAETARAQGAFAD